MIPRRMATRPSITSLIVGLRLPGAEHGAMVGALKQEMGRADLRTREFGGTTIVLSIPVTPPRHGGQGSRSKYYVT